MNRAKRMCDLSLSRKEKSSILNVRNSKRLDGGLDDPEYTQEPVIKRFVRFAAKQEPAAHGWHNGPD